MGSVIIALPKTEDAKRINEILKYRGIETAEICTSGATVLSIAQRLDSGIVICGRRLSDMNYVQLSEYLPDFFDMLLISSADADRMPSSKVIVLHSPFKHSDLVGTVEMMLMQLQRRIKKYKTAPKKRTEQEQNYINNAKMVLMDRNHMTEQEAFRYIQKCSMDSGTNMVETAQMILLLKYDE